MKKIFLVSLIYIVSCSYSLSEEFQNSIAMHGETKRPDGIKRDIHINPNAPMDNTLKLSQIGTFNSLNPYIIHGVTPPGIKGLVIESLMTWSPDEPFSLYPGIAEKIKVANNRNWVEFQLDPAARFSNGEKITPEDIIFTWKTLKEKGRPHTRSYYSLVKKVIKKSENIIRFEFSEESNYEMPLIIGLMPVLPESFWKNKIFDETTLVPLIGSGPYKIIKLEPGNYIIYEKNLKWWRNNSKDSLGRYNFQFIRYDFYRDINIALEAFLSKEYDIYIENDAVRWNENLANNDRINIRTFQKKSPSGIEAIIFNTRRHPLNDINVRKALNLLFPYEFINKVLFHGMLLRTFGPWDNTELAANNLPNETSLKIITKYQDLVSVESLKPINNAQNENFRKKLKKAINLLNQSGWSLKNNFMVNKKDGKKFEFTVLTNQPRMERLLLVWAQKLKRIGITLKVKISDSAQFQFRLQNFDYDAIIFKYYMSLSPGNEQNIYWGSWAANQKGSRNYAGINHPAIDESIEIIINSKKRETLIEATQTLDRLLRAGNWMLPLFHDPKYRIAFQKDISIPATIPLYGFNPWIAWRHK